MSRILICDSLEESGIELLRQGGAEVDKLSTEDRPRLPEVAASYDALIVRSATQVTREVLTTASRLRVVGRAGIGVDNIDIAAATEMGVLVVNAPTANLMSATELTFALMLALARQVTAADSVMKDGKWDRKAFVGVELYGKTLGIVGFGQIGQRVAARARGFEMRVLAYDPFLNADVARQLDVEPVDAFDQLIERADVLTFHTPLTDQTRGMLNRERLAKMRPGSLVVNCGRGGVVDEKALLEVLDQGPVAGAGLDVYSKEPPADFALAQHPKVVATPHIGAQTHEAQERIGNEISRMVLAALEGSLAVSAVNLPFRPAGARGEPFLRLGEQLGRFASGLLGGGLRSVRVDLFGVDEALAVPVSVAALRGALVPFLGEAVNYVNAQTLAKERGVELVRATSAASGEYSQLIGVSLVGAEREIQLAGTLHDDREPRIVRLEDFALECRAEGLLLVMRNRDVPGVVGLIGTLLGEAQINIADIHLARRDREGEAMAVLRIDAVPSDEAMAALRALPEVEQVDLVDLR